MDPFTQFVQHVEKAGYVLDARKIRAFTAYLDEIRRINDTLGLISGNDMERIPTRHFLDSLTPAIMGILPRGGTIVDIGSGGGLPGIPLSIFLPCTGFVMVESNRRKSTFQNHVRRMLALDNAVVKCIRAESLKELLPVKKYDGAVARAVGSIEKLAGLCEGILKPGGKLFCYKGPDPEAEIELAGPVMEKRGLVLENIYPYETDSVESPTLVVLKKD